MTTNLVGVRHKACRFDSLGFTLLSIPIAKAMVFPAPACAYKDLSLKYSAYNFKDNDHYSFYLSNNVAIVHDVRNGLGLNLEWFLESHVERECVEYG